MPAILAHASIYPPQKWNLILRPLIPSKDQLWQEMTKQYELSMAKRHIQNATRTDMITNANSRMLRREAREHLNGKASIRMTFEEEADVGHIQMNMEHYDDNRERVFKNRMDTIQEDQEFQPDSRPPPKNTKIFSEDIDTLTQFQNLLANDEIEFSFRPRFQQIIQLYNQIATKKAINDDPHLAWDLFKLREEVEDHVRQCPLKLEWQMVDICEINPPAPKTSLHKAMKSKIEKPFKLCVPPPLSIVTSFVGRVVISS